MDHESVWISVSTANTDKNSFVSLSINIGFWVNGWNKNKIKNDINTVNIFSVNCKYSADVSVGKNLFCMKKNNTNNFTMKMKKRQNS